MIRLRTFFLLLGLSTTTAVAGCAADAPEALSDDGEGAAIAEEQDLTAGGDWNCTGKEDHQRSSGGASVRTVRVAAHPAAGFDRFVMEFRRGDDPSSYLIRRQADPVFYGTGEGPGSRVAVKGDDGLAVIFLGETMEAAKGPKRLSVAGGTAIQEAAEYEDFESNVEWGLGTKKNACFKTFTLANPPRLVVDVKR